MRLWSIHPKYLDRAGILALWREALLAQKVLKGETKGYKNHPQLTRFKNHKYPMKAIAYYLGEILNESKRRDYKFDESKIGEKGKVEKIPVTGEQLKYEFMLLIKKLQKRDIEKYNELINFKTIECHPLFEKVEGNIEKWERIRHKSY